MKLLFERLDSAPEESLRQRVVQALDQLLVVQYLADRAAPPGIFNFGLPHAIDVATTEEAGQRQAALVAARIRQFEPRLTEVRAEFRGGEIAVTAQLEGGSEEAAGGDGFAWKLGGSR